MNKLTSRKLAASVAAMLSIVGIVLGAAVIGGVDKDIVLSAVVAIAGLGGFLVMKQSTIDAGE